MRRLMLLAIEAAAVGLLVLSGPAQGGNVKWKHLSSVNGDLPVPNPGKEQTASLVCDIDKDGVNDFAIAERTQAPALVWYRRGVSGLDPVHRRERATAHRGRVRCARHRRRRRPRHRLRGRLPEQPGLVVGESRIPDFDPQKPWKRHIIKDFGGNKHHDLMFGDFDGDGRQELVFWNQGSRKLYLAEIPENPAAGRLVEVHGDLRVFQRQRDVAAADPARTRASRRSTSMKGWPRPTSTATASSTSSAAAAGSSTSSGTTFMPNIIDAGYQFSRAAAGQLIEGGRPEVSSSWVTAGPRW